jgi:hypothetical protein
MLANSKSRKAMPSTVEPEQKHIHITVNLTGLLGGLLISLQRLIDRVSIGLVGAAKVNEVDYAQPQQFAAIQLAPNHRLALAEAREDFESWCLKNSFTEAIELLSAFLEQGRTIAASYKLGSPCSRVDFEKAWHHDRRKFHRLGLPEKIKHLRKQFGVQSKFEPNVLSLNRARNCLVQRLGRVSPEDGDPNGNLTLTWHALDLILIDKASRHETPLTEPLTVKSESDLVARIGPRERQLKVGDRILFDQIEHKNTMLTFYVFALEIAQSIEKLQPPSTSEESHDASSDEKS